MSLAACPAVAHCVGLARVLASAIGRKTRNDVEGRLGSSAGSAASVGSLPALPGESVVRDAAAGHAVVVASGIPVVTLSQLLDELFLFSFKLAADSSQEGPDGKLSQASQDSTSCQDCIVVHRVDEQPAGMTLQHVVGRFGLSSHGTMSSAVLASVFCVCGPPQPSAVTAAVLKNWLTEAMVRANAGTSLLDVSPCMHPSSQALGPCTVHMPDPVGHRWLVGVCHCLVSTAPRAPPPRVPLSHSPRLECTRRCFVVPPRTQHHTPLRSTCWKLLGSTECNAIGWNLCRHPRERHSANGCWVLS